jgi:hypothetical protein
MKLDWDNPCDCVGLQGQHEFGSPGCAAGSDGYDRTKPRYRLFDLSEEADGRPMVWFVIDPDNRVGKETTPDQSKALMNLLNISVWKDGFWRAFKRNKKATIYAPMIPTMFRMPK